LHVLKRISEFKNQVKYRASERKEKNTGKTYLFNDDAMTVINIVPADSSTLHH